MIGRKSLHVTAERPNFPLGALDVRAGSAANVALFDVPVRAGVSVTAVWMRVTNCDGVTDDFAAVQTGTLWVVDVPAAHFSTPGDVPNGVEVWASGTGADGEPHTWNIGVGDLCVRDGDSGAPVPGVAWTAVKLRETVPENPTYGDAMISSGAFYVWDGSRWIGGGGGGIVDDTVTRTSSNAVKSSGIWSAIWGTLTALPTGFTALYDWVVEQLAGKLSTSGGRVTGDVLMNRGSAVVFGEASGPAVYTSDGVTLKADTRGTTGDVALLSDIPTVPTASTSAPVMDGTASAGSSAAYARGDHRHPTDTSRQAALSQAQLNNIAAVPGKLDASVTGAYSIAVASGHLTVTDLQTGAVYTFAGPVTNPDDVARGEDLPYVTGVVMGESEGVHYPIDRAVNSYEAADGDTTLTLDMPQPMPVDQGGRARDFIVDVDNSANSSALGIEFNLLGEDYALAVADGDDLAEITELAAGERARFYFTETAQTFTPSGGQEPISVISIQRMTIEVVTSQGGA